MRAPRAARTSRPRGDVARLGAARVLHADRTFLERVVVNLLSNAARASERSDATPIEVRTTVAANRVWCASWTTVPASTPTRGRSSSTPSIGLTNATRASARAWGSRSAKVHRGDARRDLVEDTPGGGRPSPSRSHLTRATDEARPGAGGHDEEQIRRALQRALDARGYTVATASDGEEALAEVDRSSPT